MKSIKEQYDDHIEELVKGLLKNNKKKAKQLGFSKTKLTELVSKEIPYKEYLRGRKVKRITVNGMEFVRKTKFADPSNFQAGVEVNTNRRW